MYPSGSRKYATFVQTTRWLRNDGRLAVRKPRDFFLPS